MADKIKVIVEVDPDQETVIKPVGVKLAAAAPVPGDAAKMLTTGTATVTGGIPNGGDADADIDF